MKVQRVRYPDDGEVSWLVLDNDYLPIAPIHQFLRYLENVEKSPNTIRAYAYHLKLYWEFLTGTRRDWTQIRLGDLADFVHWLRDPQPGTLPLGPRESKRRETTINAILTAVTSFYEFHQRDGRAGELAIYREAFIPNRRYKNFLYHLSKRKPVRTRLVQLKAAKRLARTLTPAQVQQLIAACPRYRDQFLLCLLYDTGMRIGQALGLRHQDVVSWENEIRVIPRFDNANRARAKGFEPYTVHVAPRLMRLYSDYLVYEFDEIESDYVFVNLWGGRIGEPMTYANVVDLFRRLAKKTGIAVHPHLLRHTHATELIESGWDAALVQRRLGHADVQTTVNTYTHLSDRALKEAHRRFAAGREDRSS